MSNKYKDAFENGTINYTLGDINTDDIGLSGSYVLQKDTETANYILIPERAGGYSTTKRTIKFENNKKLSTMLSKESGVYCLKLLGNSGIILKKYTELPVDLMSNNGNIIPISKSIAEQKHLILTSEVDYQKNIRLAATYDNSLSNVRYQFTTDYYGIQNVENILETSAGKYPNRSLPNIHDSIRVRESVDIYLDANIVYSQIELNLLDYAISVSDGPVKRTVSTIDAVKTPLSTIVHRDVRNNIVAGLTIDNNNFGYRVRSVPLCIPNFADYSTNDNDINIMASTVLLDTPAHIIGNLATNGPLNELFTSNMDMIETAGSSNSVILNTNLKLLFSANPGGANLQVGDAVILTPSASMETIKYIHEDLYTLEIRTNTGRLLGTIDSNYIIENISSVMYSIFGVVYRSATIVYHISQSVKDTLDNYPSEYIDRTQFTIVGNAPFTAVNQLRYIKVIKD